MDYSYIPPSYNSDQRNSPWPKQSSQEPAYPIMFWIAWILLGIPLLLFVNETWVLTHFFAQLILATTWLALAPRVSARFFVPAALFYTPMLILGLVYGLLSVLICLAMFGLPWIILRAFRLLALDFLVLGPDRVLMTPHLAERTQFSLRTIGAVCVIAALGCALWIAADHFRSLKETRYFVAIFVPCELLFLLGMLGRMAWYWRAVLLTVAPSLLLGWTWIMGNRDPDDLWISLLMPADQFIVLAVLRRAGYRLGMPRSPEELRETKLPQSPWD